MKTILSGSGKNEKPASESKIPILDECQKQNIQIGKQNVVVVDTPGLCNPNISDKEVVEEIKRGVLLVAPGPHVFLFVMDLERFTQQENDMVELIWKTFGNADKYAIVLFTYGDKLKKNGKTIKEFIQGSEDLKNVVAKCNGGCHVIDNKNQEPSQVAELLQKMNDLVVKNEGKYYTSNNLVRNIALSVNGSALAGAGVGAATTYFVGGAVGIKVGAVAGAAVGGVVGCIGIVALYHIKAKCGTL